MNYIINSIAGSYLCPSHVRTFFLKKSGIRIGENVSISPHCFFGGGGRKDRLIIGNNVFINHDNFFDLSNDIIIGDNVSIGMRCTFITSGHEIGDYDKRAGKVTSNSIVIGNGAWIGACVTILPGIKIGNGVVIAAGSIVTNNCYANYLYAGVPAKPIKKYEKSNWQSI